MRDLSLWFRNCFARGSRTVPALRIFALAAVIAFEAADWNEGVSSDIIALAKHSFVLVHENIEIFKPSVTIYKSLSLADSPNVIHGVGRFRSKFHILRRIQGRVDLVFSYYDLYYFDIVTGQDRLRVLSRNHRGEIVGYVDKDPGISDIPWGLAKILEADPYDWVNGLDKTDGSLRRQYISDVSGLYAMQMDICSLQFVQRSSNEREVFSAVFGQSNGGARLSSASQGGKSRDPDRSAHFARLDLSKLLQPPSGPPQCSSKDDEAQGTKGDGRVTILNDKDARTTFIPTEHDKEVGDTFFRGLLGFLALYIAYALLKRFSASDDPNTYSNNKERKEPPNARE